MTDDLIKRVAERLGWTWIEPVLNQVYTPVGIHPDDKARRIVPLPPWLTSVDAALGVINPSNEFELWRDDTGWNCSDHGRFSHGQPTECRAILLAFLEAPHD